MVQSLMAGNKFATMLNRKTSRLTVVLVYAILEWLLIILLLLNSLFSFLIRKYAAFFGLKPPCPWCSRVDHVLGTEREGTASYLDGVCEAHAREISGLGYCWKHGRLVEAYDTCDDCSFALGRSRESIVASVSLVAQIYDGHDDKGLKCSCCGAGLRDGLHLLKNGLFKASSYNLGRTRKGEDQEEEVECKKRGVGFDGDGKDGCAGEQERGIEVVLWEQEKEEVEKVTDEAFQGEINGSVLVSSIDDASCDAALLGLKDSCNCGPFALNDDIINSITERNVIEEMDGEQSDGAPDFHFQSMCLGNESPESSHDQLSVLGSVGVNGEQGTAAMEQIDDLPEREASIQVARGEDRVSVPKRRIDIDEIQEAAVSFHGEGRTHNHEDPIDCSHGYIAIPSSTSCLDDAHEDILSSVLQVQEGQGVMQSKESIMDEVDCGTASDRLRMIEKREEETVNQLSLVSEFNEIDDEKAPDTPTYVEGIRALDQRLMTEISLQTVVMQSKESRMDEIDGGSSSDGLRVIEKREETVNQLSLVSEFNEIDNEKAPDTPTYVEGIRALDQRLMTEISLQTVVMQSKESRMDEIDGDSSSDRLRVIEKREETVNQLSLVSEFNEIDNEKAPDTPTYVEGIRALDQRLMTEMKESGAEPSEGSVVSEIEGGEAAVIERLKAALKAEHKALNALYAELEEERSAAAIAANQTMAMITRLQEEKATIQMEAVQYQRMMEEQSEYDQEALQLLNELMVKREKEKQDLERELELYRRKVMHYEARERRMRKLRASENGLTKLFNNEDGSNFPSSASSSGADSDEFSLDSGDGEDGSDGVVLSSNQNTPAEAVTNLSHVRESTKHLTAVDESLAAFEEERLLILEQLKTLEEKLLILSDEESGSTITMNHITSNQTVVVPEESLEAIAGNEKEKLTEKHHLETDNKDKLCCEDEDLDVLIGTPDLLAYRGKRPGHRTYFCPKPKQLLPLFDADIGNEEEEEEEGSFPPSDIHLCKQVAIEDEVEHVYERLQALEADGEFLKHSVNSLKKGDKGMDLLQEILQHLRDLKAVEQRARHLGDPMPF